MSRTEPSRLSPGGRWLVAGCRLPGGGRRGLIAVAIFAALGGCQGRSDVERLRQEMFDQSRYEPLEASTFFGDGLAGRPPVRGTVARGQLRTDAHFYTGKVNGEPATKFPVALTDSVLTRGRDRYDVFCSPCHDLTGSGNGMVVRRGLRPPPSFHIDRLRQAPPGHLFDVMTSGFGIMYSYASRLTPADRWAVAAYVKALQLSRHATLDDVPPTERRALEATRRAPEGQR